MGRGCIVILDDLQQPALLLGECGRLCRIRASSGTELSVGQGRLLYVDPIEIDEEGVQDFARQVLYKAEEIDLIELWNYAIDEEVELESADGSELLTGEREGLGRLAFELSLKGDTVYFDTRGGTLKPRKRRAVEQEILRRDRLAQQQRTFNEAVAYTLKRLAEDRPRDHAADGDGDPAGETRLALAYRRPRRGGQGDGTEAGVEGDDGSPAFFDALRRAAIEGEAAVGKEIPSFLDRVGFGSGSGWETPSRGAFELLCQLGELGEDEDLNILRYGITRAFPEWMTQLSRDLPAVATIGRQGRLDLEAYTIDDASTRDYDDALALEEGPGGTALHILIADPSSVIDPESPIWKEARRRGSTIYHPQGKAAMLPPSLSEGHLSLVQDHLRPAMDFVIHLDDDYAPWGTDIRLVNIRVRKNLTYDEVDGILSGSKSFRESPPPADIVELMLKLRRVANRLQAGRIARGAMVLRRPEVNVRVRRGGDIELTKIDFSSASRELVAEMMIACGEQAAAFVRDKAIPAVYRKQSRNLEPGVARAGGIVDGIVPWYAAVRQFRKAELSVHPGPHEGLGLEQYVQVTSPLRRFHDLQIHEQIRSYLVQGNARFSEQQVMQTFAEMDELMSRNQRIQNDARRYWILTFLRRYETQEVLATPVAKERRAWKVWLDDYGVEAFADLGPDAVAGEPLTLRVEKVDPRGGVVRLAP